MTEPLEARTAIGSGKLRELKQICDLERVDLVVFVGAITETQQKELASEIACEVVGMRDE